MEFKVQKYTTADGMRCDCDTVFFQRETGSTGKNGRPLLKVVMTVDWTVPGTALTDANVRRDPRSRNPHITPNQLTPEELEQWVEWKTKRDLKHLVGTDLARYRAAAESAHDVMTNAAKAISHKVVALTQDEALALWKGMALLGQAIKQSGFQQPKQPRGRPRAKTVIYDDDESTIEWLPNFHPPGTPEHEAYERLFAEMVKKGAHQ